jgi:hypothetical protein
MLAKRTVAKTVAEARSGWAGAAGGGGGGGPQGGPPHV